MRRVYQGHSVRYYVRSSSGAPQGGKRPFCFRPDDSLLKGFCVFFLESAIDQVEFMQSILQPSELLRRIKLHVDDEISAGILPRGSVGLLREALLAGEVERGRAAELTGYQERRARDVLSALLSRGLLVPTTPQGTSSIGISY
jgi:hypothetical protein